MCLLYRKSGKKDTKGPKQWPPARIVTSKRNQSSEQLRSTKLMSKVKPLISPNLVENLFKQTRFSK